MRNLFAMALSLTIIFLAHPNASAQPADVQIRVEGIGVSTPDTVNGLQAMVPVGSPVKFTWSIKSIIPQSGGTLGSVFYSPSNPNMSFEWLLSNNVVLLNPTDFFGVIMLISKDVDGQLPELVLVGGAIPHSATFQSNTHVDAVRADFIFNDTGIFCIDTAFFPPSGEWLMVPTGAPTWGGTPVGYPDGGFCITVTSQGCCDAPGDANGDLSVNISDLTYIIARIFSGGPAPVCENDGDANGDQALNIADAAFLVSRIFGGGPAPHCWWQPDPNAAFDYTFVGVPDTLQIANCGAFTDTLGLSVKRPTGGTIFDLPAIYSIVDESAGITASLIGPNLSRLTLSGTVISDTDGFVVVRASSGPLGSGAETDKIILVTCQ